MMQVEVFSDLVCPWCYIGKRRLEEALDSFPHASNVQVTYRSFQLDPTTPSDADTPEVEHLADKYGLTLDRAQAMMQRVSDVADSVGLHFDFDTVRTANTFDAHRLLHWAASLGKGADLKERLLAAHFSEGKRVGDGESLVAEAVAVGLDANEARAVLAGDSFADAVREDLALARTLGVSSVPFFVINRKYGIAGAQEAATLRQALEQAWTEDNPLTMVGQHDHHDEAGCVDGVCHV